MDCSATARQRRRSPTGSSQKDFGCDIHAGPEQPIVVLPGIDDDLDGHSLHDLHVVAGRVFRGKQTEAWTRGTGDAVHVAPVGSPGRIDVDAHALARPDFPKLRLLEV